MAPRKVVVFGATGELGTNVTTELLACGPDVFEVTVVVRPTSDTKASRVEQFTAKGARVALLEDISDAEGVTKAIAGNEIVISCLRLLGPAAQTGQTSLVEAAKKSGTVKLFIPADFGFNYEILGDKSPPVYALKRAMFEKLKSSGINWLVIDTGAFTDAIYTAYYGFDLDNNRAKIGGGPSTRVALIHRTDIAKYLARLLQNPDAVANKRVTVYTQVITTADFLKTYQEVTGKTLEVTYVPYEEDKAFYTAAIAAAGGMPAAAVPEQIRAFFGSDGACYPESHKNYATDFPDITPITLHDYLVARFGPAKTQ